MFLARTEATHGIRMPRITEVCCSCLSLAILQRMLSVWVANIVMIRKPSSCRVEIASCLKVRLGMQCGRSIQRAAHSKTKVHGSITAECLSLYARSLQGGV